MTYLTYFNSKFIAHRGLFNGPNPQTENSPTQIMHALALGFDVEIDLWCVDSKYYLGHDGPVYHIPQEFLRMAGLWVHAKNIDALSKLSHPYYEMVNYFWHENDAVTLTSKNFIWTYPGQQLLPNAIAVMPEMHMDYNEAHNLKCAGYCSDYIATIRNNLLPNLK